MRIVVEELCYAQHAEPFIKDLQPYMHQLQTLEKVRRAISARQTICIENTSVTGSGKTLANFAAAILDGTRTIGVYPTNELLYDQYGAIEKHLAYNDILRLDSRSMDEIIDVMTHMRSHAQALAWATGEITPATLLTNPDVLYFAMYDLYGQMYSTFHRSHGAYIFQHILSNYPVIAFDEFHLYNAKQIANAAFIMGTIKALAPRVPHVFIFSSATPQPLFKYYTTRPRKPPCFNRGDEWTYLLRRMGGGDSTLDVTSHSR